METLLYTITGIVLFSSAVVLVAGGLSYVFDCYLWKVSPEKVAHHNHVPIWDQDKGTVARHQDCYTCEIQIIRFDNKTLSASSAK
jgi:hypothetical protein